MQSVLAQIGTRQYAGLWLLLILASAVTLISIATRYRDSGKWWLRTNVGLFVFIISPAVLVAMFDVFGGFFDWLGFPAPLVWLLGMATGEVVIIGGYFLGAVCVLLGLGTVAGKGTSQRARIASIAASLISCFFIAFYLYVANRPQRW